MSDENKVKLVVPKSLMVVLWLIAGGLFANGLQFLTVEPVSAQSGLTKVAICRVDGAKCADFVGSGVNTGPAMWIMNPPAYFK